MLSKPKSWSEKEKEKEYRRIKKKCSYQNCKDKHLIENALRRHLIIPITNKGIICGLYVPWKLKILKEFPELKQ